MTTFFVHFEQSGGCDYTVACGQRLEKLPDHIQTMDDAVKHVLTYNEEDSHQVSQVGYYGGTDDFKSVKILEVTDSKELDLLDFEHKLNEKVAAAQRAKDEEKERAELARLKEKYGE